MFTDSYAGADGSGVGILLISSAGEETQVSIRLGYKASNNEAEYEVILSGVRVT